MPADNHTDPALEQPKPPIHPEQSVEEKLDVIIKYLHRMDRRDRIRMSWGTIHGFLTIIPLVLTLFSLWYFYAHSQDLIQSFAGAMSGGLLGNGESNSSQGGMMEMIQNYFKQQGQ